MMKIYNSRPLLLVLFAILSGAAPACAQYSKTVQKSRKTHSAPSEQAVAQSSSPSPVEAGSAVVAPSGEAPPAEQPTGKPESGEGPPSSKDAQQAPQTKPSAQGKSGLKPDSAKQDNTPDSAAKNGVNMLSIGIGLGLINQPAESSLESDSMPIEMYVDYSRGPWIGFRAGFNQAASRLGDTTLESTALYIAYLKSLGFFQTVEAFALIGLFQISSTLTLATNESREDSGLGTVFGGGAAYRFGSLLLGGQLIIFNRSGDFGGIAVADGSNQLQLTASYALY